MLGYLSFKSLNLSLSCLSKSSKASSPNTFDLVVATSSKSFCNFLYSSLMQMHLGYYIIQKTKQKELEKVKNPILHTFNDLKMARKRFLGSENQFAHF